MADSKILVGQFIGRRAKNPDTPNDPWDPVRDKSPLEVFPDSSFVPVGPAPIPFEKAPQLSTPAVIPFEKAPDLSVPAVIPFEKAPPLGKPAEIPFEPAPPLSVPPVIPFEPAPPLRTPDIIPFEPAPPLRAPDVIPFEPAPPLRNPDIIPFEPAPPLPVPAPIPFEPAPPLRAPDIIPFEPAPPLTVPQAIPFEPAPPMTSPGAIPFEPAPAPSVPAILPTQPAPPPSSPAALPKMDAPATVKPSELPKMPSPTLGVPDPIAPVTPPAVPNPRTVDTSIPKPIFTGGDHPFAPGGQLPDGNDIITKLSEADVKITQIFSSLDSNGQYVDFASGPGTQAVNPLLYAKSLVRLGNHLGKSGLARFAAEQLGLFLLNRHGKIWNPVTADPPPIAQNFVPAALDVLTGTPRLLTGYDDTNGTADITARPGFYEVNHGPGADDMHLNLAKGEYNEFRVVHYPPFFEAVFGAGSVGVQNLFAGAPIIGGARVIGARSQDTSLVDDPVFGSDGSPKPIVQAALELRNKYYPGQDDPSDGVIYPDHAVATMADLVDDALEQGTKTGHIVPDSFTNLSRYTYRRASQAGSSDSLGGIAGKLLAAGKAFIGDRVQLRTGEYRPEPGEARGAAAAGVSRLDKSAFPRGIIPAAFSKDGDGSYITTRQGQSPTEVIDDDESYVPLSFTDLRPSGGNYRTVYFRPFIKSLNETFSPEWNQGTFFGRSDPVATYVATARVISLAFMMAAFGPEDLKVIYNKLNWLASMVYPEYDKDLLYLSGPVVRMRVGDVINAVGPEGARGLPGIIQNLEFDYNDSPWELKSGLKVPMQVNISLSLLVLHDRPIGRGGAGKFGGQGIIKDGRFVPPGKDDAPGAGNSGDVEFPTVTRGLDSFRSIGKGEADSMNDYDRLGTSTTPKTFNV